MSSKLLLVISSGRNHVLKATLKLSGPPGVTFRFQASTLYGNGKPQNVISHIAKYHLSDPLGTLECANDNISILDLAEYSEFSVLIPHSDASAYHTMVSI
jgi:hypothetical protein